MNRNYKGDDTVGRLMHDFDCKEAKDMYYLEPAKGVKHFKEEGGRETTPSFNFSLCRCAVYGNISA